MKLGMHLLKRYARMHRSSTVNFDRNFLLGLCGVPRIFLLIAGTLLSRYHATRDQKHTLKAYLYQAAAP